MLRKEDEYGQTEHSGYNIHGPKQICNRHFKSKSPCLNLIESMQHIELCTTFVLKPLAKSTTNNKMASTKHITCWQTPCLNPSASFLDQPSQQALSAWAKEDQKIVLKKPQHKH